MKNKIGMAFVILMFSSLSYADNGGVASDGSLYPFTPDEVSPGNSLAAQGGYFGTSDANCIGDAVTVSAKDGGVGDGISLNDELEFEPGIATTKLSLLVTIGAFVPDCAELF